MTFSIVEFEEGNFNVICTKWLQKEKGTLICFWPKLKTSMEYYKTVQKLSDPDVTKWEKAKVTNILGHYDSYNSARIKLKDAEMHTDIGTDPDSRGKGKRRKKNIYRYGFDTDEENDSTLKTKIPKRTLYTEKIHLSLPKLPKELMQFQDTSPKEKDTILSAELYSSSQKQSTEVKTMASIATYEARNTDKKFSSKLYNSGGKRKPFGTKRSCTIAIPSTSVDENICLSSKSDDTYDKHEMSASVVKPVSRFYTSGKKEKQSVSTVRRSSPSLQTDENDFTLGINTLKKKNRNVSSTANPLSELMDENTVATSRQFHKHKADAANTNTEYNNNVNFCVDIAADAHDSISSADTLTKGRQGLQLQKLLQNDECFKKFVISELLENASYRKKFLARSLQKEHNQFHLDVLPYIDNVESLEQFNNKLTADGVYRNKVILHMSKIGGRNCKKITMAIMGKIIHCTLAKQYSWKGGKGKLQFCLFNGLLTAVTCATRHTKHAGTTVAADATEEDIVAGIKEFLRQSIGRAKIWEAKQQNERNPDDPDEYVTETEETSILNESGSWETKQQGERNPDEHMTETEEASNLNESSKESKISLTDVEDNSNKHLLHMNEKRVSYVEDSDDSTW